MANPYTYAGLWSLACLCTGVKAFVNGVVPLHHVVSPWSRCYHALSTARPSSGVSIMMAKGFGAKPSKGDRKAKSRSRTPSQPCACFSGKPYGQCCKPFHDGDKLPEPQELMRARYSAYASVMPDYIMETTHPGHADYGRPEWRQELLTFCQAYRFTGLEVDAPEQDPATPERVYVYFTALMAGADCGRAVSFDEKSVFLLKDGVWYYREADKEYEASVELISKRRYQRAAKADKPKGAAPSR